MLDAASFGSTRKREKKAVWGLGEPQIEEGRKAEVRRTCVQILPPPLTLPG